MATTPAHIRHMLFEKVCDVLVCVHDTEAPTAAEWNAWEARTASMDYKGILVVTEGGGPTGPQRKQAAAFWERQPYRLRMAVVTESAAVRGILTALHWIGVSDIVPFAGNKITDAMKHVGLGADRFAPVAHMVNILQRDLQLSHGVRHDVQEAMRHVTL